MRRFLLCVPDIVVIKSDWFLGYFVGNTFWLVAISYYIYITFLGYNGKFPALLSCARERASYFAFGNPAVALDI